MVPSKEINAGSVFVDPTRTIADTLTEPIHANNIGVERTSPVFAIFRRARAKQQVQISLVEAEPEEDDLVGFFNERPNFM
jgi:hypothetical protein